MEGAAGSGFVNSYPTSDLFSQMSISKPGLKIKILNTVFLNY